MYNTKRWIALAATASITLAACGTDGNTSITTTTAIGAAPTTAGPSTGGTDGGMMSETTALDAMTGDTMVDDSTMTGDTMLDDPAMTDDTMVDDPAMTDATTADSAMGETGDVMATALSNPDFSILAEAITTAGLQDALSGPGPFTILAPENAAFERTFSFLGTTKEAFMADKDGLANLLSYHVIPGSYPLADLANMNGARLATLQGTDITVTVDADGKIKMNTGPLAGTESLATNGVVLPIGEVLFPKPGK